MQGRFIPCCTFLIPHPSLFYGLHFRGNVVITDLAEFLALIQLNIDNNRKHITGTAVAQVLKWGEAVSIASPDYILIADCIYYKEVSH